MRNNVGLISEAPSGVKVVPDGGAGALYPAYNPAS
jgi:hypothetical protein